MLKSPFVEIFSLVAVATTSGCDSPESRLQNAERVAFDAASAYNDCVVANAYEENGPTQEVCASFAERADQADAELARVRREAVHN